MLRTAMMLSCVTGKPFEMTNIRAKRPNPGLRPQHLAALKAFSLTTSAEVEGAYVGSPMVRFTPGGVRSGEVEVDVGTAGSVTLILACLLPALSLRGAAMKLKIIGGTDTKWSPTFDYFSKVAQPLMSELGVESSVRLLRRGYYPQGQGEVEAEVRPSSGTRPIAPVRGECEVMVSSVCSNLEQSVGDRQVDGAREELARAGLREARATSAMEPAVSPGTAILVWAKGPESTVFLGGDAVGERGVRAEDVGAAAARAFVDAYSSGSALDIHAADMAAPLLLLADGRSEISFPAVTGHITSNLDVGSKFVSRQVALRGERTFVKLSVS